MAWVMRFDRAQRVLLVRFGRALTQDALESMQAAIRRFSETEGRCRGILDLTAVEDVDVPSQFITGMAQNRAIMGGEKRVIVASSGVVFGLSRMFAIVQSGIDDPPAVVRTMEEAYAFLSMSEPNFEPLS